MFSVKRGVPPSSSAKRRKRDLGQQSDRERRLQIIVVCLPGDQFSVVFSTSTLPLPCHDDEPVPDLHMLDEHIVELSCKNTSKFSEEMAIEVNSL